MWVSIIDILKYVGSHSLPTLLIVLIAMWIGKFIRDLLTRYKIDEELTGKNNGAVGIEMAGYYIGLAIAIAGVLTSSGSISLSSELLYVCLYSVIAIIFMSIAAFVNESLILYKFDNQKELVEDQNSGTGATMAGSYIATGFIINASVSGELTGKWWEGLLACLVFFVLGQGVLIIAGLWYQMITKYDIHKVIGEDNNVAAGIGFGGFLAAIGYVVRSAMLGESLSWSIDLVAFVIYVVIALILLTIGKFITDIVFLPKAKMDEEIGVQKNIGAAFISLAIYAAISILVVHAV